MTITELIARLEAGSGGDRALNWQLHLLLHPEYANKKVSYRYLYMDGADYTTSLDSALAFAEAVIPGCYWIVGTGRQSPDEPLYGSELFPGRPYDDEPALGYGEHEDAARCLLLATLRALQAKETP